MFKSPAQAVRLMALTGAAIVAVAAQPAFAADTAELGVSATVSGVCNVTTTPVAFGSIDVTTAGTTDATGSYSVVCTSGTAWTAAADAGNGATASVAVRKMTSGANLLNYGLFTDVGRATNFATGGGAGTGAAELTTIYGRIASGQVVPAGSYADSVTISLTY
jgi:spore coat protein U-like protein